ncbi:MAG: trigger factor [Chloroflexi bacterium]|nr:trigger factor [Chloroflexota bacterium]
MKVTTERTADCNAIVTVEVDDEQLQTAMKSAAQRVSRVRPMPGFRPGKAPYAVVERAVGKDLLRDEAIEELAQSVYRQVIKDENIDVYDAGKLDVPQKEPLILKFTIPTRPVVTLGDYRSIQLRPAPIVVSDDEVKEALDRLQMDQGQMVPVTRPAQMGDLVTADMNGGIEGQPTNDNKGLQIRLESDKPVFPWLEQLVGMNVNEPRTITYVYPADESDEVRPLNPNLAGKTATYTVNITDIKEPHLPPIDDELAKAVSQYESLDQLKGYVRNNLAARKQIEEDNRFTDQVIDAVVAQAQIAHPASMLDDEIDQETKRSQQVAERLGLTWPKYLELSGKTADQYREEQRPRAEMRLRRLLVILQLVEAENIEASGKEVDIEIDRRAQEAARAGERADQVRRSLATSSSRRDIEFSIKMGKAVERMVAIAKGEPTRGTIVTPEMVREELRALEAAEAAKRGTAPPAGGLITDPGHVRPEDWPRGLDRPIVPGQEK